MKFTMTGQEKSVYPWAGLTVYVFVQIFNSIKLLITPYIRMLDIVLQIQALHCAFA